MSQVPQTLGEEITDEINAYINQGDRFQDWDSPSVVALRTRIEKLQKVNAREAFVSFGSLAAICGYVEGVRDFYRKAMYLPDKDATNAEFYTSFGNVGLYGEAQDIGIRLLDVQRQMYTKIWKKAVSLGLIQTVLSQLPYAKRNWPELNEVDFGPVERVGAVMREHDVSDKQIGAILDLMGEVQRAHRTMFAGKTVGEFKVISPPEEPQYVFMSVSIDASVPDVHAMNRDLARLVVERMGAFPSGLVGTFTKAIPTEVRAAA